MTTGFSATRCSLEGFRLMGRRPLAFLSWSLLVGVALVAMMIAMLWGILQTRPLLETTADPAQLGSMLASFGIAILVFMLAILALSSVLVAAICRAVLKPEDPGAGFPRLGGDELRMMLLYLLIMVMVLGVYVTAFAVGAGVLFLDLGPLAAGLLLGGEILALVVLILFVGMRLSLAAPLLVDQGRIDLGGSWALTRGRFWPLLGMAVLAWLLATVISFVLQIVAQPLALAMMPTSFPTDAAASTDPAAPFMAMQAMAANPGWLVLFAVFASVITTAQMVVQYAPFAAAYRALAPKDEAAVFGDPPAPAAA